MDSKVLRFTIRVILVTASALANPAGALTLVDQGRSDYVILLTADAVEAEQFAAEELAVHIQSMSGVRLPVVRDSGEPAPQRTVLLGISEALNKADPSLKELNFRAEEYVIRISGQHVIIAGGRPRGTLYGVYALLEDYLGCRWYAPDTTVVPRRETIRLSGLDVRGRPWFEYRDPWMYAGHIHSIWWREHFVPEFVARTRNSGNQIATHVHPITDKHGGYFHVPRIGHNFSALVPARKYAAEYPEYFALHEGKRIVEGDMDLCVTHPDVIRIAADTMGQWMRADPDAEVFTLAQGDTSRVCQCDRCLETYKRYSTRPGIDLGHLQAWGGLAGRNLHFANQVAKILEKQFPKNRIGIWAYQPSRNPPRNIKAHRNVFIWFNPIEMCECHPIGRGPINRRSPINPGFFGVRNDSASYYQPGGMYESRFLDFCNGIRQWQQIAKDQPVYIFHPSFLSYKWPMDLLIIDETVRTYRDLGVQGVLIDSIMDIQSGFGFCRYWLWAQALRNPDFDAHWGLRQFLDVYYGAAAPHIDRFIRLASNPRMYQPLDEKQLDTWVGSRPRDAQERARVKHGCHLQMRRLTHDAIEQAYELFEKALKATEADARSRRHVESARMVLQYKMLKQLPPADLRLKAEAASLLSLTKKMEIPSIEYLPFAEYERNLRERIGEW